MNRGERGPHDRCRHPARCAGCRKPLTSHGATYHRACYVAHRKRLAIQNRCVHNKPEGRCRICRPEAFDPDAPSRYSPTRYDRPLPPAPRFSGRYAAIQQMTPEQIEQHWAQLLDGTLATRAIVPVEPEEDEHVVVHRE